MIDLDFAKLYDDLLPEILQSTKKYFSNSTPEADVSNKLNLDDIMSDELTTEHKKGYDKNSLDAIHKDEFTYDKILNTVSEEALKRISSEELQYLKDMSYTDDDDESNDKDHKILINALREYLEEALVTRKTNEWSSEMPEFVYRGVGGDEDERERESDTYHENIGITGIDELYNANEDASPTGKVIFVSSEPSVAASYARQDRFSRAGLLPYNYGDYIYKIRTQGLDPKLFTKDLSTTSGEAFFGPQYRYNGPINQEDIDIIDQAGNTRKVPRIEKMHYLSDSLTKNVYFPKHLIEAINKRF